jgi:hypothetical protein
MAYAVCKVPVAPLRAEAAHKSEMISQLLLAEAGLILEESKDFIKLQGVHDGYEGWCQRSQLAVVDTWTKEPASQMYTAGWVNTISINNVPAHAPMGIPVLDNVNAKQLSAVLRIDYRDADTWNAGDAKPGAEAIRKRAEIRHTCGVADRYLVSIAAALPKWCSAFSIFRCCAMLICRLHKAKWLVFCRRRVAAIWPSSTMPKGALRT